MKTFQQYLETNGIDSPAAGVAQTMGSTPQLTPVQQQPMTQQDPNVNKQQIQQLLMMLSKKLGVRFNQYKPLINDIQPKNMNLFFGLIQDLSTLKQSAGDAVVKTMQNRMS